VIQLSEQIIGKLTWKGILAYVAVNLAGCGRYTTATLATAVHCAGAAMREGMGELAVHDPFVVQWAKRERRWVVGGDSKPLNTVEKETHRRLDLIDDLKKYWDHLNPHLPFDMSGSDGNAIMQFLKKHREWTQPMWRQALRNRAKSEIVKSDPIYRWMSSLDRFFDSPLDRYSQPMPNGGGANGKAVGVEVANSAAREAALNSTGA
jgi:hypothetical protein